MQTTTWKVHCIQAVDSYIFTPSEIYQTIFTMSKCYAPQPVCVNERWIGNIKREKNAHMNAECIKYIEICSGICIRFVLFDFDVWCVWTVYTVQLRHSLYILAFVAKRRRRHPSAFRNGNVFSSLFAYFPFDWCSTGGKVFESHFWSIIIQICFVCVNTGSCFWVENCFKICSMRCLSGHAVCVCMECSHFFYNLLHHRCCSTGHTKAFNVRIVE